MRLRETLHPLLYEINTRVWLRELAKRREKFTLADVSEQDLEKLAKLHFDLIWLMGIWQGGEAGRVIARQYPELQGEYRRALPDYTPDDVVGSPYAVQDYRVARELGGPKALAKLRQRLARRGLKLILDFVPNHTARDHPWVAAHPEFYVPGDRELLRREPRNYFVAQTTQGEKILAHGRDPHFSGWTDTVQLNYWHPELRTAIVNTLLEIADQCDGVRCDMAMLQLEEIFSRTWREQAKVPAAPAARHEFWSEAIDAVRRRHPDFLFIAEAYWGLELQLQALGFDYTYDKVLYDHLAQGDIANIRDRLQAGFDFHRRSVHFLENHDEARAAESFPPDKHQAAAVACYATPGMRLFHEGQLDGRKLRLPVQLARRSPEPPDGELRPFYEKLLAALAHPALRQGSWELLQPTPASEGNTTWEQVIAYRWATPGAHSCLAIANLAPSPAQCYIPLQPFHPHASSLVLSDLLTAQTYQFHQTPSAPLYFELAPYQCHIFTSRALS